MGGQCILAALVASVAARVSTQVACHCICEIGCTVGVTEPKQWVGSMDSGQVKAGVASLLPLRTPLY